MTTAETIDRQVGIANAITRDAGLGSPFYRLETCDGPVLAFGSSLGMCGLRETSLVIHRAYEAACAAAGEPMSCHACWAAGAGECPERGLVADRATDTWVVKP